MASFNRLFVAKKPMFVGSNSFLSKIKRRYRVKKAGFSGTLDPFACGVLIIAFGQYTKLFRFLQKTPKTYRATLWLGAVSDTLDIEQIERIDSIQPFTTEEIQEVVESFQGDFEYIPPKYSAKRVNGKRAYDLARAGESVELARCHSQIYEIRLLHYRHPFVTFEATVSEGTYIRSLGDAIAKKLETTGALSYLERICEGKLIYDHEKPLDPLDYLAPPRNRYLGSSDDLLQGKKLQKEMFENQTPGTYTVVFDDYFSIIEIDNNQNVSYLLNKVKLCSY